LPPGVKGEVVGDQSSFIKASLSAIQRHLVEGSILAAIVVFIFLWSFRSTLIAALADSDLDRCYFCLMARWFYAEPDHHAGADIDGWNRD